MQGNLQAEKTLNKDVKEKRYPGIDALEMRAVQEIFDWNLGAKTAGLIFWERSACL